ncbi:hypothetical protein FB451DRAFT_1296239 [Mycena latifolia]|nr:hypothetical protein FB451DRAFT_1296239 [Mycena latifolia]
MLLLNPSPYLPPFPFIRSFFTFFITIILLSHCNPLRHRADASIPVPLLPTRLYDSLDTPPLPSLPCRAEFIPVFRGMRRRLLLACSSPPFSLCNDTYPRRPRLPRSIPLLCTFTYPYLPVLRFLLHTHLAGSASVGDASSFSHSFPSRVSSFVYPYSVPLCLLRSGRLFVVVVLLYLRSIFFHSHPLPSFSLAPLSGTCRPSFFRHPFFPLHTFLRTNLRFHYLPSSFLLLFAFLTRAPFLFFPFDCSPRPPSLALACLVVPR